MTRAPTGIAGFDHVTCGGLPAGRVTLLEGGPGAGKTLLALQFLAYGAQAGEPPGLFVAFEEAPADIVAHSAGFTWADGGQWQGTVVFLDARPSPDLVQSGNFDLDGLLAILGAKVAESGARRIVIDAIDVLLTLMPDAATRRRELYRLHHWLQDHALTAIITAKASVDGANSLDLDAPGFLQFMVDCAVALRHDVVGGVSQRSLRVPKYRGSTFAENRVPLLIGPRGIEVAHSTSQREANAPVTNERLSTGVERLDAMLAGGHHRGASILISGAPGTAKTTLCGAFAAAACRRGEPTLFVSFDSPAAEVVRNMASVAIDLAQPLSSGQLRLEAMRSLNGSAELHLLQIKSMAEDHGAQCLIIDPLSALSQDGNTDYSHSIAERLIDWAKAGGITLLCTSLIGHAHPESEGTPLQVSTIADTWIHLSYTIRAGERNRALTIIKSRGTGHSNQVRELLLTDTGVTLEEVYLADGEVLMGTLRWARENEEIARDTAAAAAATLHRLRLQNEAAELEARLNALRRQLEMSLAEYAALEETSAAEGTVAVRAKDELRRRRRADQPATGSAND